MGVIIAGGWIVLAVGAALLAAAAKWPLVYAAVAATAALTLAAAGVAEQRRLTGFRAGRSALAMASALHTAYVWALGALTVLLVYGFLLSWREWLTFGIAMAVIALVGFGLAVMFYRDTESGRTDDTMLSLARILNIVQTVGMGIAMLGLVIDGKMRVAMFASRSDWAANSTFFFGALAIAVIGGWSLLADRAAQAEMAAADRVPSADPAPTVDQAPP